MKAIKGLFLCISTASFASIYRSGCQGEPNLSWFEYFKKHYNQYMKG